MTTLKLFTAQNNQLILSDTSIHSYRTKDINLLQIGQSIPAVLQVGFYIYNNTNVAIDATPVLNVFGNKSLPDVFLTTTAIPANTAAFIPISSEYFIANYFSVNIQASATPKGYVTGFAIINYNYTIR